MKSGAATAFAFSPRALRDGEAAERELIMLAFSFEKPG
jgi:hypothetical protein